MRVACGAASSRLFSYQFFLIHRGIAPPLGAAFRAWLESLRAHSTVGLSGVLKDDRPYGDLYMEVAEPFRRRGLGSYLVQELKRLCYELGAVPCARCSPTNTASRRTLQKAGFVPFAHIIHGPIVFARIANIPTATKYE